MALKRGTVELADYSTEWTQEYEQEAKLLREVLAGKFMEINHVGSTSIIDMQIVVESLDIVPEIDEILKKYDYTNRGGQGLTDSILFVKGPEDARTHYVHTEVYKSDSYYNHLYFKKYLLEHPEYIEEYCKLKEELALKYPNERPKYTQGKNEFISSVIKMAKEEYDKPKVLTK